MALVERVGRLDLPADARLYLLIVGHVRQINEATPGALAHLALDLGAASSPPDTESALAGWSESALVAGRRAYEHAVRELISQGIASGRFRAVDPKLAALAVLGASNWTARWFRPDGPRSAAAIGEDFAGLLIRGLLADGVALTAPDLRLLDAPTSTTGSGRPRRPLASGRKHP